MRKVTRFNPFHPDKAEGVWVRSMRDSGMSVEEIYRAVNNHIGGYGGGALTQLVVDYQLGLRPFTDIEPLLTPNKPTSFVYLANTGDGFLCEAQGDEDSTFLVLVKAPSLSEEKIRELIAAHQDEFCFFAFANAHEGHPFGYSLNGASGVAKAGIHYPDLLTFAAGI